MKNRIGLWFASIVFPLLLFAAVPRPGWAQEEPAGEPTIAKDSIDITLHTYEHGPSRRANAPIAWSPAIKYTVNGPIASGSQLWVEFSFPGRKGWMRDDCRTAGIRADETWETKCFEYGETSSGQKLSVTFTGMVDFAIHLSNELLGTKLTLFQGKMKVAKIPSPKHPDFFSAPYYVDEDWRIPIGYLYRGQRTLETVMYFRGKPGEARPHLFYQGKQVAAPENCGAALFDPQAYRWFPVRCEFFAGDDTIKELKPGEYEIRVLQEGKLTRTAKFTVGPDGSYDNGIATANKLGSDKVIIPVKVLVDHAPWDKLAWKTGAFYGNPLTGFTAPP